MYSDFRKIANKPFKYRDECDFFSISKDNAFASFKFSHEISIQNALVFVGCENDIQEWRVENGKVKCRNRWRYVLKT